MSVSKKKCARVIRQQCANCPILVYSTNVEKILYYNSNITRLLQACPTPVTQVYIFFNSDFKPLFTISQVFHHVLDQQGRNRVHWPRNICLGHVPIEVLGLFPVSFLEISLVQKYVHTMFIYNFISFSVLGNASVNNTNLNQKVEEVVDKNFKTLNKYVYCMYLLHSTYIQYTVMHPHLLGC